MKPVVLAVNRTPSSNDSVSPLSMVEGTVVFGHKLAVLAGAATVVNVEEAD
jgi:hypothetical protein